VSKIVRYAERGRAAYGWLEEDSVFELGGDVYGKFEQGAYVAKYDELRILAPCEPTKIVGVGRNYRGFIEEIGAEVPDAPILFLKPPSSVIGPGGDIVLPDVSIEVTFEAELAVVMKLRGRHIPPSDVGAHVLGYTCGNDVTAHSLVRKDATLTRAKGFDTFCPLGPCISTDLNASNLTVQSRVNDRVRQQASTVEMVYSVSHLVSYISQVMTLEPGDVILTGTPHGAGPLKAGDVVEVEIEGIGVLTNSAAPETDGSLRG